MVFGVVAATCPAHAAEPAHVGSEAEIEITVAGVRPHPMAVSQEPSVAGSTIRRPRLEQAGVSTPDVLREAPGIQVSQTGGLGAVATARLRGATAQQTPVYLGDVRINDEVGGVADLSSVPTFLVERIEIGRSSALDQAGALGMGGAIFFVPRAPRDREASVGTTLGSFGTRGLRTHFGSRTGGRSVLVGVETLGAENDYTFNDTRGTLFVGSDGGVRRLENADSRQNSLWLLAREPLGPAALEVLVHHADREQGALKLALVQSEAARAAFHRNLLSVSSHVPIPSWDGVLTLSTHAIQAETTLDDPRSELGLMTPYTSTPGARVEQMVEAREFLVPDVELVQQLSVSVERLQRIERSGGTNESKLSARRLDTSGTAGARVALVEGLSVSAFGTLRCYDPSQGELEACARLNPTARGGALWRFGDVGVFGSAGQYRRFPTLSELYGAGVLVRGNPTLKPERGTTLESGVRWQLPRRGRDPLLWAEVAAFARWSSDLVTYVRTAQGFLHPLNRATSRTLGGELTAGVAPVSGLSVEGNVSVLDPRDTSPDRRTKNDILPFLSRLTAFVRGEYRWRFEGVLLTGASLGVRTSHQSSRFGDPAGLGVIPAQSFTDLELGLSALADVVSVRGRVSNLFDARRFDVVGFPLPGRGAFLSMEVTW